MVTLVQLTDGCYKLTIDVILEGLKIHREYTFAKTETQAEPLKDGEYFRLPIDAKRMS